MKTMLTNRQLEQLLDETSFEKFTWSGLFVYLVCSDTGMYFQVDNWDDNTLAILTSLPALNNFFKEVQDGEGFAHQAE